MPFNRELEDFAQAFSSGYGMTKSKEEREADQLALEKSRFEVGRLPTLAEQQDAQAAANLAGQQTQNKIGEFDLSRRPIEAGQADQSFQVNLDKAKADLDKAKSDAALSKESMTPENVAARAKIVKATTLEAEAKAAVAAHEASPDNLALKDAAQRATIAATDASTAASLAAAETSRLAGEGTKVETDIKRLALKEAQHKDKKRTLYDNITRKPLPAENQPRVIGGGAQPAPEEAVTTAPAGPAPFVYEPPASSAGGPVNTGNGATFPGTGAGATRGAALPAEAAPAPAEAVPEETAPDMVSDIFSGGVERKPVGLMQVEDDSTAPVRQRVLDHVANGGGEKMPNGKRVLDVAGKEAVKDGLQQVIRDHGLDQDQAVDTPETENQQRGYLGGSRAASPETVDMFEQTIQEQAGEELSQNELTYYSLASEWLYYNSMGEPEAATAAAASLLQHYQRAFSQYASVAQAASSNGDIDGAMEASVRAYANVPTGDELHLSWTKDKKHIIATITDMDGVTTQKQLMTPEEMGAYAMNVNPSSFVTLIAQAAGREEKETKASGSFAEAVSGELGVDVTGWTTPQINAYRQSLTDKAKTAAAAEAGGKKSGSDIAPSGELKTSPIDDETITRKEEAVAAAFTNYLGKHDASWLPHLASEEKQRIIDEELAPMTTTIALQNTGKGLTTQNVVQIVTELTKNRPVKWREIDDNTYGVTAKNQPEIKIGKDQFDALTILRGQQEAAGFTSEQAAQDAAAVDASLTAERQAAGAEGVRRFAVEPEPGVGVGAIDTNLEDNPRPRYRPPAQPVQPYVPPRRPDRTINLSPFK